MLQTRSINTVDMEDGIYPAQWFAYTARIIYPGGKLSEPIKLNNGIRGFSTVSVTVKDKILYVNE